MANRIADNIRRIVWDTIVKEWGGKDGRLSDLLKNKDAIPGKRGIGYQQNLDNQSAGAAGVSENISGDKTNAYDPLGTTQEDPAQGSKTASAADILNDATNLGSSLSEAIQAMDGITDPNSGADLKLNFHDKFDYIPEGYDADGTYTPDWNDPDEPPDLPDWEQGKYWYTNVAGFITNSSYWTTIPQNQASKGVDYLNALAVGGQTDWIFVSWSQQAASSWIGNYESAGAPANKAQVTATKDTCTPGSGSHCPVSNPKAESWPADGDVNFKFKDGQFQTSQYDPERPLEYVNKSSKVEFNYGSGQTGAAEVTGDGGYMVYETSAIGGAATGTVKKFDSRGVINDTFPASEIGSRRPA